MKVYRDVFLLHYGTELCQSRLIQTNSDSLGSKEICRSVCMCSYQKTRVYHDMTVTSHISVAGWHAVMLLAAC